jgi:hypothetical protein
MSNNPIRDALESMVWQFAHRGTIKGKTALSTGGLSALEEAFQVLGWSDPHFTDAGRCEIDGCSEWATCIGPYPRSLARSDVDPTFLGFGQLCGKHMFEWHGKDQADLPEDMGRLQCSEGTT